MTAESQHMRLCGGGPTGGVTSQATSFSPWNLGHAVWTLVTSTTKRVWLPLRRLVDGVERSAVTRFRSLDLRLE